MRSVMRTTLLLVAALALALGLAACGGDDDGGEVAAGGGAATTQGSSAPDLSGVTLRVGVQKDGVRSVLERSGVLDNLPYSLEYATFQFGPPIVEAAGADRINVGWVGSVPPINGAAAGADFRVVAAFLERDRKENSILVPGGSPITDLEGLRGKTIAVPKASSAHGLLINALKRAGIEQSEVTLSFLAPADALAAFQSGQVDALTVWDPFVTQVINAEGARELTGGEPDEHGVQFEIASAKALEDPAKRAAVADFVQRLARAFAWAGQNPDLWAQAWTDESKLPLETTSLVVRNKVLDVIPVTDEIIGWQQALADTLFDAEVIPSEVTFADIVDATVYTDAAAEPSTTTAP